MPTVPANAPSSTASSFKPDGVDYEPDEEWKIQLRKRIEEGLQQMVADAKESQAAELRKGPDTPETRIRLEADYKEAMQTIKGFATEQYQFELDCERNRRRWTAGVPMTPGWTQYFREEQQNIMNSIKQSSNQTDHSVRTPNESPTEERRSAIPPPSPHDRHQARSPPRPPPEVWKPAISPAEDAALPPKTYKLGRRGSAASMRSTGSGTSMRSTGSGASIRPSITETIPERADDGPSESAIEEHDYERAQETTEQGRSWISTDKSREKEKRPHLRRNSRPSVDSRPDELGGSSPLRSAGSSTMQYATSAPMNRPLSAKPSLLFDDRHSIDTPGKPPPYYEYASSPQRDSYPHRDQQAPSQAQDQLSARPNPARSSYGGADDNRDYGSPYSTPHRPHGPKLPYYSQRRSISRQASFTQQPYVDLDDDDDEKDVVRGGERHWEREYDRDRDRDGGRDVYSESRRAATYPHPSPRHPSYSNPSPVGPRPPPQEYIHTNNFYDDRPETASGPNHGRYNRSPDDWEFQRSSDGARPTPSRQSSYIRPRDDPDRRYSAENDGYSRPYPPAGGIPIPRHTPNLEEPPAQPAWREWAAEGNRHPIYDHPHQARSPPNPETFPHRRFPHPPPSYHSSPRDDRSGFVERETDPSNRGNGTVVTDEYDSDGDSDSEDDDSSEDGVEAKRLRDLEAKRQKLEENKRAADDELKKTELEIERLASEETRRKKEEEEKRKEEEEKRKEEEEKRKEVEQKEEEARKREEDALKKEEEVRKMEEEVKKKEEEAVKKAAEVRRMEEEARRKEQEAKKMEEEARKKEQEARKKEKEARRKEEEARKKAEELNRKEEEARQRAAQLKQDTEKTKQMQLETQKIAEDLKKKEEEAVKKDILMREREDILLRREEELMRREADNLRREQEAKVKEEEAIKKEAAARKEEEARKKEEMKAKEARKDAARKAEEARKEEARQKEAMRLKEEAIRKEEEARKEAAIKESARLEEEFRKEEARKREEAMRKKAEEAKRKQAEEEKRKQAEEEKRKQAEEEKRKQAEEEKRKQAEEEKRKQAEEEKRKEEDSRREEARLEDFRREQAEKRLMNESQHFDDMLFELDPKLVDPKLMDEQLRLLQEAGFRKREEDIRRTRQERKRNDSVGNDNAWPNPSYLSASPGTSPSVSRPPQFNGQTIPERNTGPSSSWGAGPASPWSSSIKPTAAAATSPGANRSSSNASQTKPRTGSVSSGTFPTSSSPHPPSFSEAERTRKQQEFAESQQEQFRRTQEKLEAERRLKSAGRPLSREELQRVFEHHERLWNRLNTLNELSWNDFPWPMAKQPSNPDEMSLPLISAYMQYPDKDKLRTTKDRIKEHIKRWHPDRFETKLLPKVVEDEREKVKHGAGNVARYLSDLLRKENESNNNIFGD